MSDEPTPLLLVLAHGVGVAEFAAIDAAASALPAPRPLAVPPDPVAEMLRSGDATLELNDLGIAVDRSSLVLRPAGRTDPGAVARFSARATGPAPVTLLEAKDVLAAATTGGAPAAIAAARRLGDLLVAAQNRLRRGEPAEVWFLGLGSAVPVVAMFDFHAAWQRRVVAPLANDLHVRLDAPAVSIVADNRRALDLAAAVLTHPPFAAHGTVAARGTDRIVFLARDGTAFGRRRIAARADLNRTTAGVVAVPRRAAPSDLEPTFADVLARFWMRAAALHVVVEDERTPTPTSVDARQPPAAARNVPASSST